MPTQPFFAEPLPTPEEMTMWDTQSQAIGIHGLVLLENAAQKTAALLLQTIPTLQSERIACLLGSGNNGGDCAAIARYLHEAGCSVHLYCLKEPDAVSEACATQLGIATALGIPRSPIADLFSHTPTVVLDGLLGTGFRKPLKSAMATLLTAINAKHYPHVVALDIPSGLCGTTGTPQPVAIQANQTIAMQAPKLGLMLPCAAPYVGTCSHVPIGIPRLIQQRHPATHFLLTKALTSLQTPTLSNSYKTRFGSLGILGGGTPMHTGACHLACLAALRMGTGMVYALTKDQSLPSIRSNLPELMALGLGTQWTLSPSTERLLSSLQALVIGPGMGLEDQAGDLLASILTHPHRPPMVLDADALTLLAANTTLLSLIAENDILTPHPGEAARLLGCSAKEVQNDRLAALHKLTCLQKGVVVLKGAGTLIGQQGKPTFVSPWDLPILAIPGSGDVLAGIIGALVAQASLEPHFQSLNRAAIGVTTHCLCAHTLSKHYPNRGLLAHELCAAIPEVRANRCLP